MALKCYLTPPEHEEFTKRGNIVLFENGTTKFKVSRISDPFANARHAIVSESNSEEFANGTEVRIEVMGNRDLTARAQKEEEEDRKRQYREMKAAEKQRVFSPN